MQTHNDTPTPTVTAELRLKPGVRIVRTPAGWNIWDDYAEDTVKRTACRSLVELLEWIGDDTALRARPVADPMLVTEL